jgi:hypothetical protein
VTLSGSAASLRDVIQQLCAASGVELRQYDAQDRPFAGSYEGMPLSELLPRLLRSESYAAGLRSTAGQRRRPYRMGARHEQGRCESDGTLPSGDAAARGCDRRSRRSERRRRREGDDGGRAAARSGGYHHRGAPQPGVHHRRRTRRPAKIRSTRSRRTSRTIPAAKTTLERADPAAVGRKLAEFPDARSVFAMIQSSIQDPEMQRHLNQIASALNAAVAASLKP